VSAAVPSDGTPVRVKQAGLRPGQSSMPGVRAGTPAVVRHQSPSGHSNLKSGLVWLELDEPIMWSFGVSESAGFWAGRGEYELVDE
jgi:hypothetical protein